MPYKRKEDRAAQMRRYRRRKKAKNTPIQKLRKFQDELDVEFDRIVQKHLSLLENSPEFQNASPQDQAQMKQHFAHVVQLAEQSTSGMIEWMDKHFRELEIQLPVVVQKVTRDAFMKIEKERKELVEKELRRIIGALTDEQKLVLWKLVQTGKLAEKMLENSIEKVST